MLLLNKPKCLQKVLFNLLNIISTVEYVCILIYYFVECARSNKFTIQYTKFKDVKEWLTDDAVLLSLGETVSPLTTLCFAFSSTLPPNKVLTSSFVVSWSAISPGQTRSIFQMPFFQSYFFLLRTVFYQKWQFQVVLSKSCSFNKVWWASRVY